MLIQFVIILAFLFPSIGQARGAAFKSTKQFAEKIDLNRASVEDLLELPGVGVVLAERIVTYRRKHGPFKRSQDVIIVRGMSARRFRQIAHLIRI